MRQNTNLTPQRLQCDELLHMIILEAMSEMEKTDIRLDDPSNQYQWMNITQAVTFSLLHGNASFSRLLKILYESVRIEFISENVKYFRFAMCFKFFHVRQHSWFRFI